MMRYQEYLKVTVVKVKLNGFAILYTKLWTLQMVCPESSLAALVKSMDIRPTEYNFKPVEITIKRNPKVFKVVLDYLK